jgi:hypothetical protein
MSLSIDSFNYFEWMCVKCFGYAHWLDRVCDWRTIGYLMYAICSCLIIFWSMWCMFKNCIGMD